jgi:AraC-like DNA-binding protein
VLSELAAEDRIEAHADPVIVLQQRYEGLLFLNPGEVHVTPGPSRVLVLHAAREWLRSSFPAAFEEDEAHPFAQGVEMITPRIRQLADTLAVEVLNDRFLSPERLEFMLQELLLSIVETYLARRRAASPLWRGSKFEDTRIRRAIALLRAKPNKELNMDELASQVGLSRSRFYDLFQLCTGFSPRAYLDLAPFLRARQDRRGSGRAGFLRAKQLHAILPEPGRRPTLGIPPRGERDQRASGSRFERETAARHVIAPRRGKSRRG